MLLKFTHHECIVYMYKIFHDIYIESFFMYKKKVPSIF